MKVLVTGAAGFLGKHLVVSLRAAGHEVLALCRKPDASLQELGAEVLVGDILHGGLKAESLVGCDAVVHAAGKVSRDPADAELLFQTHVDGTKAVLKAAEAAGVARAVVISTSGVVAVSEDATHIGKESDAAPLELLQKWPYYRSKLFAEEAALLQNKPGFSVCTINPTLLLGPGDAHGSSTEDVRMFLEKKIPMVPSGGLSFVDVRDVAAAVVSALTSGRGGERYLLAACNMTLKEFFGRLERVSNVKAPILPMPKAPALMRHGTELLAKLTKQWGLPMPVDPVSLDMANHYWYVDASKAEDELGFAPREPNETLRDTVEDLRARGVVWS
jgi:dihydroflavonol-4-reductase